jgi:hypothetical protein
VLLRRPLEKGGNTNMDKENQQHSDNIEKLIGIFEANEQNLKTVFQNIIDLSNQVKLLVDQKTPKPNPEAQAAIEHFRLIGKSLGLRISG